MRIVEYTSAEIQDALDSLRKLYDEVRLVDPEECRVLEFTPEGRLKYGERCYAVWGGERRCENCASFQAVRSGNTRRKLEYLGGEARSVEAVPVRLCLEDGDVEDCAMEMIRCQALNVLPDDTRPEENHDRDRDSLTMLYRQETLYQHMRERLMTDQETSFLIITGCLYHFPLVRSLFGAGRSNAVLLEMSRCLRACCFNGEVYGRLQDDHFAVMAEKDRFDEDMFLETLGQVEDTSVSPLESLRVHLGLYEVQDRELPLSVMLDHADLALESLSSVPHRASARFTRDMLRTRLEEQRIITEFEENLRNGRYRIYLQPQVDALGRIHGAEALVRWIQEDGSVVLPGHFLPVLERSELISHLDTRIWEQAVQQLAAWKHTPLEALHLSVNIDPRDFYYMDVTQVLTELCRAYGVEQSRLRVEITETALVQDVSQGKRVEELQSSGFSVEIDDFGKGSSSLSMLKDVRASRLKIDMGFLHGEQNLHRSVVILNSVIRMARELDMDVICEGVETAEQLNRLIAMGCEQFQGFYFSRPIPVNDFESLYRKQQTGA